jgi:Tfp pilus assembly PilM family ATPase
VETRYIRIPKLPKKQIPNAVFWTFSKEVDFNEKQMLLDFRILGDVNENGITKTQVMTFTIPIAETQALKRLFAMAGYPLSGISIVPFAIQNLLKTGIVPATGHNTCCLFIGRDWSRITIYAEGDLILSRGIKAGMRSMIDALSSHYRHPSTDDTPVMPENAHRDSAPNDEMDAHDVTAHEDFQRYLIPDTDARTRRLTVGNRMIFFKPFFPPSKGWSSKLNARSRIFPCISNARVWANFSFPGE